MFSMFWLISLWLQLLIECSISAPFISAFSNPLRKFLHIFSAEININQAKRKTTISRELHNKPPASQQAGGKDCTELPVLVFSLRELTLSQVTSQIYSYSFSQFTLFQCSFTENRDVHVYSIFISSCIWQITAGR